MHLSLELGKIKEQFLKNTPPDVLDIMKKGSEKLANEKLEEKALKVGDQMPTFALTNAVGKAVDSRDLLDQGPLVINFYRGGW